ncbi:MAG: B12-binding domain-containing radical SAM protein [bacterium]|nr:B12-binding domain-containing radical SAM protein [bacterium]
MKEPPLSNSQKINRFWDIPEDLAKDMKGYAVVLMNVRSYRYVMAAEAARMFKRINPEGLVIVGGMHTLVAREEMEATPEFDKICVGPGETVITELASKPENFPRVIDGKGAASMRDWPVIDRTLWPKPRGYFLGFKYNWPLEAGSGWGPRPVASLLTSRVCPWQCAFCNEASYIPNMGRRSIDSVIDELNSLDKQYHLGSFVIHDSMFFQQKKWLEDWAERFPREINTRKSLPYWAAARADTVCEWPELFETIIKETNWSTVSIGFESGSDPVLKILNKQVTEEENHFVIDLVNRIGDDQERAGQKPVSFWANTMLAIPGETPEDAFKTIRMVKRMKRTRAAVAYYAPFPGSLLGYQLIAEGKNLMTDDYERNPYDPKVKGIDYTFYDGLIRGEYNDEIAKGLTPEERARKIMMPLGFLI